MLSFFISCGSILQVQKTTIRQEQLPVVCNGLVELINTSWIKSKINKCHFDNGIHKKLEIEYGDCLKLMNKSQILELLGSPDDTEQQFFYYYFFDEERSRKSPLIHYLFIGFDKENVYYIESGRRVIMS